MFIFILLFLIILLLITSVCFIDNLINLILVVIILNLFCILLFIFFLFIYILTLIKLLLKIFFKFFFIFLGQFLRVWNMKIVKKSMLNLLLLEYFLTNILSSLLIMNLKIFSTSYILLFYIYFPFSLTWHFFIYFLYHRILLKN